jgi:hypothetical protein
MNMTDRTYRNGILVEPDEGYSGWTNYPTWAVKLWIDNDEGSCNYWREQVRHCRVEAESRPRSTVYSVDEDHRFILAALLKDEHEEALNTIDEDNLVTFVSQGVFGDLLTYALGCVNWVEIAESLISEVREESEANA